MLISGIISFTQIYTTWLQNDQELKIQSLQKQKELEIQHLKNEADAKLGRGQLIFANIERLNSPDADAKKLAISALIWTLGNNEADKLFSFIQQYGSASIQNVAASARTDIQKAKLVSEARIIAWNGNWTHAFTSDLGRFEGLMKISVDDSGLASGEFNANDKTVIGSLKGSLSDDGKILVGTWRNTKQNGRFYFELLNIEDAIGFRGNYSMSEAQPEKGASLTWTGKKK